MPSVCISAADTARRTARQALDMHATPSADVRIAFGSTRRRRSLAHKLPEMPPRVPLSRRVSACGGVLGSLEGFPINNAPGSKLSWST